METETASLETAKTEREMKVFVKKAQLQPPVALFSSKVGRLYMALGLL